MGLARVYSSRDPLAYKDLRSETDDSGLFRFPRVVPATDFWLFVEVGSSLPDDDAVMPVRVQTKDDGSTMDVGELPIRKGHRLAGKIICSDGKNVPAELVPVARTAHAGGELEQRPGPNGRFEFRGLPDGPVSLLLHYRKSQDGPRYGYSAQNRCRNPEHPSFLEGRLHRNIDDLTILLDPGVQPDEPVPPPLPPFGHFSDRDPAAIADFNDAKAGPITGVPPRP